MSHLLRVSVRSEQREFAAQRTGHRLLALILFSLTSSGSLHFIKLGVNVLGGTLHTSTLQLCTFVSTLEFRVLSMSCGSLIGTCIGNGTHALQQFSVRCLEFRRRARHGR